MTLLVTGGHGFVMSNLIRSWLDRDAEADVVLLDRDAPDPIALRFFEGCGDWIHVADVASALIALLEAERPRHAVYNAGSGQSATLATLATLTTHLVPGASWAVDPDHANLVSDPGRCRGQWGAYDITRLRPEFGWSPAPLEERLADYIAWRTTHEQGGQHR